jgi:hypothetical protein
MCSLRSLMDALRLRLAVVVEALWGPPDKSYQPSRHYMRGPGPKWRERHSHFPEDL